VLHLNHSDWPSASFGVQVLEGPPASSVVVTLVDAAATRRERPPAKEILPYLPQKLEGQIGAEFLPLHDGLGASSADTVFRELNCHKFYPYSFQA